jgi:phosphoribosylanthranilate isomerase
VSYAGKPVISAVAVRTQADLTSALTFEEISDYLLFDAAHAGSGKAFDWALLKNIPLKKRWFLAGGLTPENVAEAIRVTGAPMVDVSSGIEDSPGNKSLIKIAAFNAAVLHAGHG